MTHELDFSTGAILHPQEGEANSVDLFRTMATFSGVTRFRETGATERLRNIVGHFDHYLFVLVDGLGMNQRDRFPSGGFFESTLQMELRAAFPSTTASVITSLATCQWPGQHGIVGWATHFPEHGRVIEPLPFRERGTRIDARELGLSVGDLIAAEPVVGSFFRTSGSFLPHPYAGGPYDTWFSAGTPLTSFNSYRHARRLVRRATISGRGPSYRYLYLTAVDSLSHRHGAASDEVAAEIARIDRLLTQIRDSLPRTFRMVVTADHGLVDVAPENASRVDDGDELANHLVAGITGEGRAPVFHLKPGHEDAFLESYSAHPASAHFTLHRPGHLADLGLYGPEGLSEAARSRLGDYVGISTAPARIEYVPRGGGPLPHVGVHGGLLPAEMRVPLFVI